MKITLNIKGAEHLVEFVRFREADRSHEKRGTVTIVTAMGYDEVVRLFSEPGEWSVTRSYEPKLDVDGNIIYQEPDVVIDCTDYEKLLCITDTRAGVLEVVMGEITDSEALAELQEALNR